jgi:hypothetical protein
MDTAETPDQLQGVVMAANGKKQVKPISVSIPCVRSA